MNLVAIRQQLAMTIQDGIDEAVNVYPYLPGSPAFPCIVITPAADYRSARETFDANPGYTLNYDLLFGATSSVEDAQILLDQLLSNDNGASVEDALNADPTLGGLVDDIIVGSATTARAGDPNAAVFTATLLVTVYANR